MTMNVASRESVPDTARAECVHDDAAVMAAFARMANRVDTLLDGTPAVALALLQGGIVPAGQLLPRLRTPVQLDTVHLTRYRNSTVGGTIDWLAWPVTPLRGRAVLLIDDILDEGHSLAAVAERCRHEGAAEVLTAVLVEKRHRRKHPHVQADVVGLEVDDRYVFGYGMDYLGWHRNAPGIFALADE